MSTDLAQFDFHLPDTLIAKYPLESRSASKLLVDSSQGVEHSHFYNLLDYLQAGDLLVFNNTKVWPTRIHGNKPTGGKFEILVEVPITERRFWGRYKSSIPPKIPSKQEVIAGDKLLTLSFHSKAKEWFEIEMDQSVNDTLQACGEMPLPPYMNRKAEAIDIERYQTVYHDHTGFSAAAPTAGLHFDQKLLDLLQDKEIQTAQVNLDISSGTFAPIRTKDYRDHRMHTEHFTLDEKCAERIRQTKSRGQRIIAVGTTVMRVIQSCLDNQLQLEAKAGNTDIFIYPGYTQFVMDGLITNFHMPKSSLLLLVSAFAGTQRIKDLYQIAIENRYRWLSYGDSMFLRNQYA